MVSLVTGAIGIAVAAMIFWLMRKDRLHVRHGLGWAIVAVLFACLGFAPWVIDRIAGFLGIASPPTLALTVSIAVLVVKIFLMDLERSRIEVRNQRLIQRVAMLNTEMRNLQEKCESMPPESIDKTTRDISDRN